MYSCGGPCIAVEAAYSCGGPYRDIYNYVLVCMAMYPFPISIPIFGYFKPLYDKYTKYLPRVLVLTKRHVGSGNEID